MEPRKILKARQTVLEMLKQRGFSVDDSLLPIDQERLELMTEVFWEKKNKRSAVFDIHISNSDSQAYVAWLKPEGAKGQAEKAKIQFNRDLQAGPNDDLILIVVDDSPPSEQMYLWENNQTSVFSVANLQYNITNHNLVPKHTVLSNSEGKRARLLYHAGTGQFPALQRFQNEEGNGDAVARFYGMRVGDVVRVTRETITSGTHLVYREVVGDSPS